MELPLLANALDFIISAGDYANRASSDPRTRAGSLKYAVLHLHAGSELLIKERLRREHWALLYDKPDEASRASWKAGDFRSVGGESLQRRLEGIAGVALPDETKKLLRSLREQRNRLEHFAFIGSEEVVRALVYEVSSFALDFAHEHFEEELGAEELQLLDEVKKVMFDNEEFVEARMNALAEQLDRTVSQGLPIITCPACLQEALAFEPTETKCLFCRSEWDSSIASAFEDWDSSFLRVDPKEKMDVYRVCPECEDECFINIGAYEDNSYGRSPAWLCFSCGFHAREEEIDECMKCGQPFLEKEDMGTVCKRCFAYVISKDD
ncbi:MAG: hypothetical protein Q7R32_07145 [Dehalococcoidia bacterium]|nr:hypothetical protein [Dehalococcoidia bacterium]